MENEKLLKPETVAELFKVTQSTLKNWRRDGAGPKWCKICGVIRYYSESVYKLMESEK